MDAIEAVAKAKEHALELFAGDMSGAPSLEGIQPDDHDWEITLSFTRARPLQAGGLGLAMNPNLVNYRKKIRIKRDTGALVSVTDPE